MIELLQNPWHWSVGGILIGLTVPVLLLIENKKFGISATLRDICAACIPNNISFFKYDWKAESWNLLFVTGIFIGGIIGNTLLKNPEEIIVAEYTKEFLAKYGISNFKNISPVEIFSLENILTVKGLVFFVLGGFLVGFGTRYAGGCTSGHSIMGIANLQLPSLIATISFMLGGFLSAKFILPLIL